MVKKLKPSVMRVLFEDGEKEVEVRPYHWMLVEQAGKDLETVEGSLMGVFFAMNKGAQRSAFPAFAESIIDLQPVEDEDEEDDGVGGDVVPLVG